jgi:hypothetical protein
MSYNEKAAYVFSAAYWALLESLICITLAKLDILREIDLGLIVNHLPNQFTVLFPTLLNRLAHADHVVISNLLLCSTCNGIMMQVR